MSQVHVAEQFHSIQGEGPYAGTPAIFLRLAGCNLSCGWDDDVTEYEPGDEPQGDAAWVCVAEGERVHTPDGGVPIEDVEPGDTVMTRGWNMEKSLVEDEVARVGSKGVQECVEIQTLADRSIKATTDHEFYLKDKSDRKYGKTAASEIGPGDEIQVTPDRIRPPEDEAWYRGYLKGAFAGDGSRWRPDPQRGNTPGYKMQMQVTDREFAEAVQEAARAIGTDINIGQYSKTRAGRQIYRVGTKRKALWNVLESDLQPEEEQGWMAGFYDAEGLQDGLKIAQEDEENRQVACSILDRHEFSYQETERGVKMSRLDKVEFYQTFGPRLERKFDEVFSKVVYDTVVGVEEVGEYEVYDIETEETARFVCEGFVTKNCDTIDVWRQPENSYEPIELVEEWSARGWIDHLELDDAHIVLTGGEPTLSTHQDAFYDFYNTLMNETGVEPFVEVETNGTQILQSRFGYVVDHYNVSLKLPNSGEDKAKRINREAIGQFTAMGADTAMFKFVVSSSNEIQEILDIAFKHDIPDEQISLMPAGQTREQLAQTYPEVAEVCKRKGFKFSPRLQVMTWDETTGV